MELHACNMHGSGVVKSHTCFMHVSFHAWYICHTCFILSCVFHVCFIHEVASTHETCMEVYSMHKISWNMHGKRMKVASMHQMCWNMHVSGAPFWVEHLHYMDSHRQSQTVSHKNMYLPDLQIKDTSLFRITDTWSRPKWSRCIGNRPHLGLLLLF